MTDENKSYACKSGCLFGIEFHLISSYNTDARDKQSLMCSICFSDGQIIDVRGGGDFITKSVAFRFRACSIILYR